MSSLSPQREQLIKFITTKQDPELSLQSSNISPLLLLFRGKFLALTSLARTHWLTLMKESVSTTILQGCCSDYRNCISIYPQFIIAILKEKKWINIFMVKTRQLATNNILHCIITRHCQSHSITIVSHHHLLSVKINLIHRQNSTMIVL